MAISISQAVGQVLRNASRPLTNADILARVRMLRPIETAGPEATIRNAIGNQILAVSLGGRPAHYVWWPNRLAGNYIRQPLTGLERTTGRLIVSEEVRLTLWPTFFAERSERPYGVTLALPGERAMQAQLDFLHLGRGVWGLLPNPALAAWFQEEGPDDDDALIIHVLKVDDRRYAVELLRSADRDEPAIAARNQALAGEVEAILRSSRTGQPDWYLVPRLVARGAFRDPLPPDALDAVLRHDLRFIVGEYDIWLAEKLVDGLEQEPEVLPDIHASPHPDGDRRQVVDEEERRAWGEYLFDRGMDYRWAGVNLAAEAYYREALRQDAGHADAWVHLGIIHFEANEVSEALGYYERGEAAALERTIGDPDHYEPPFWLDVDSRPYMRALHGKGLCLWRLGRSGEARQVFALMLRLNPNDNQGVRFLLPDVDAGLTCEESMARDEQARNR